MFALTYNLLYNFNFVYSIIGYNLNFFDRFKTGFSTDFTRILFRVYEYTSAWFSINDTVLNRFVCAERVFNNDKSYLNKINNYCGRSNMMNRQSLWIYDVDTLFPYILVFDIFIIPDKTMTEQIAIRRVGLISHPVVLLHFSINCESSNKYRQQIEFKHRFNLNQKGRSIRQFLLVYFYISKIFYVDHHTYLLMNY